MLLVGRSDSASGISAVEPLDGQPINLLSKINFINDIQSGNWARSSEGISSDDAPPAVLRLAIAPVGEYDFRIKFSRTDGDQAVMQLLMLKDKT